MLNFLRKIGFTKGEVILLAALIIIFIIGLVIKELSIKPNFSYDYNRQDSLFIIKSKKLFENSPTNSLTEQQKQRALKLMMLNDSLLGIEEKKTSEDSKLYSIKGKINLNTAGISDLVLLPGIGEITAERIIELREKIGGFKKTEQLKDVKGIGDKKFEKIKDYITVE